MHASVCMHLCVSVWLCSELKCQCLVTCQHPAFSGAAPCTALHTALEQTQTTPAPLPHLLTALSCAYSRASLPRTGLKGSLSGP